MDYRIFSMSSGEEVDSTEAHVFARAYRWAWRSIYGCEATGQHQVAELQLVMEFGEPVEAQAGPAHAGTEPQVESAPADADSTPGEQHDN